MCQLLQPADPGPDHGPAADQPGAEAVSRAGPPHTGPQTPRRGLRQGQSMVKVSQR